MTVREAFVGFDSAWAGKAPGGIAWATFVDRRLETCAEPQLAGFDDAARRIETLRTECDYVLVAIDQPTVVTNETGERPVDGVARSLVAKLRSGVQPANRSKATMFGYNAPIWRFLDRLSASQDPVAARTATDGLYLLEVFPALALPALQPEILARGRAAFYNPARKKTFTLADWRLAADAVRQRAEQRHLPRLSAWARRQAELAAPGKHDQDRLDAAICLLVALEWRLAPRDHGVVIGDVQTGYMVTPVSPDTRAILEQAATEQDVPFESFRQTTDAAPGRIHFDDTLLRRCLVRAARARRTLTYGEVARRFGYPWSQGTQSALVGTLTRIGEENRRRGEPQLMALVVNKAHGRPGQGYFQAVGLGAAPRSEQRSQRAREVKEVWAFDWPD